MTSKKIGRKKNIILIKKEHEKDYLISKKFKKHKNIKFIYLNKDTDGMARTCMYAKNHIPNNNGIEKKINREEKTRRP